MQRPWQKAMSAANRNCSPTQAYAYLCLFVCLFSLYIHNIFNSSTSHWVAYFDPRKLYRKNRSSSSFLVFFNSLDCLPHVSGGSFLVVEGERIESLCKLVRSRKYSAFCFLVVDGGWSIKAAVGRTNRSRDMGGGRQGDLSAALNSRPSSSNSQLDGQTDGGRSPTEHRIPSVRPS